MTSPRKLLLLALVAVVAIAAAGQVFAADKIEISYMAWYNTTQSEADQVQATMDRFNASQDKIHVSLIIIPRDGYETKVNTMAAGKQLPTLCKEVHCQAAGAGDSALRTNDLGGTRIAPSSNGRLPSTLGSRHLRQS